jgi:hypothetical protein
MSTKQRKHGDLMVDRKGNAMVFRFDSGTYVMRFNANATIPLLRWDRVKATKAQIAAATVIEDQRTPAPPRAPKAKAPHFRDVYARRKPGART